ncbi:hypothetical protein HHL11_01120 [Ramlibacter sp. G-1-2-2]|uniref:Uncharacterized protein n=1 Tax=Ramlibacter agri TaxID=2728837 RepID=A0A848GZT8_9BURK|nr:hypothetical protein [Ramlibacter agri]NML42330.1 hypothetical protein [Ramlibacter agri]
MARSNPSAGTDACLKAVVSFQDPTLAGRALDQVARSYRPLLDVRPGEWMSCRFERIGSGAGGLKLYHPYDVLIRLEQLDELQRFHHKDIWQLFAIGRALTMMVMPDRVVATGTVKGLGLDSRR